MLQAHTAAVGTSALFGLVPFVGQKWSKHLPEFYWYFERVLNPTCWWFFAGETPSRTLAETATERARETALAAKEKAKDLASHAQKKQYV